MSDDELIRPKTRRRTVRERAENAARKRKHWCGSVARGYWASPSTEEINWFADGYEAGYRAANRRAT